MQELRWAEPSRFKVSQASRFQGKSNRKDKVNYPTLAAQKTRVEDGAPSNFSLLRKSSLRKLFVTAAAEELFDFADVRGAGVGGEALHENLSVLFFKDSAVEQDEQAAVAERADEASEALL